MIRYQRTRPAFMTDFPRPSDSPVTAPQWRAFLLDQSGVVLAHVWDYPEVPGVFVVETVGGNEAEIGRAVWARTAVGVLPIVLVQPARWYHRCWAWLLRSPLTRWAFVQGED